MTNTSDSSLQRKLVALLLPLIFGLAAEHASADPVRTASVGQIVGTVTARSAAVPVVGNVDIYDSTQVLVQQIPTGDSGVYASTALAAGDYRVVASSDGYSSAVYGGDDCYLACNQSSGTLVHVDGSAVQVDVSLTPIVVTAIRPLAGASAGGEHVLISGAVFDAQTTVTFDGLAANIATFSGTSLEVVTPPHAAGVVDVTVTRGDGASIIARGSYTYEASPSPRPYLVRDLTPSMSAGTPVSSSIGTVNGAILFGFSSAAEGRELWSLQNGTSALVRDLRPGTPSSDPRFFTTFHGGLYFIADGPGGTALWTTDGTYAGTSQVAVLGGTVAAVSATNNRLLMLVDGATGRTLWASDGTPAGTTNVMSVHGSLGGSVDYNGATYVLVGDDTGGVLARVDTPTIVGQFDNGRPFGLTAYNGALYFAVTAVDGSATFLRSDGSSVNSVASFAGGIADMTVWQGLIYLAADDGLSGREIWTSDGSSSGTILSLDIAPGPDSVYPVRFFGTNTYLFFATHKDYLSGMWRTDGTLAGTLRVTSSSDPVEPGFVGLVGNHVIYTQQQILMTSDGTLEGTAALTSVPSNGTLLNACNLGSDLWVSFSISRPVDDGLFITDGLPQGSTTAYRVPVGETPVSTSPAQLVKDGSELYFTSAGDVFNPARTWKSDGTLNGTTQFLDQSVFDMASAGGLLYFAEWDSSLGQFRIWVSDNSPEGAHVIPNLYTWTKPTLITSGSLCYVYTPDDLIRTDGTAEGSFTLYRHYTAGQIGSVVDGAGELYFLASWIDSPAVLSLWKTDGTVAGTVELYQTTSMNLMGLLAVGRSVAVATNAGLLWWNGSAQLISTDGVVSLVASDGHQAYFLTYGSSPQLWVSDGTTGGTHRVVDSGVGATAVAVRGFLYYSVADSAGVQLWRTDGTHAGTSLRGHFNALGPMTDAGGVLLFAADDGLHGMELWKESDAGLSIVDDLAVGSSTPADFRQIGDLLFFTAWTDLNGRELFAIQVVQPSLTSVSPTSGSSAGGYAVTASGANLASGMRLTIGGVPVSNPTTTDGSSLSGTVNPLPPGMLLDVAIEEGDPVVLPNAFFSDFLDVPASDPFHSYVEKIVRKGITVGCGNGDYCPSNGVSRLQMAIFLARAMAGGDAAVPSSGSVNGVPYACSSGGTSLFSDIAPDSPFCRHVHYIASRNVTRGCSANEYCPSAPVTRLQMAGFLARAIAGSDDAVPSAYTDPTTGRSYDLGTGDVHFTDIASTEFFDKHANYIWARGITDGCGATTYCPASNVIRLQMAKFLATTFP